MPRNDTFPFKHMLASLRAAAARKRGAPARVEAEEAGPPSWADAPDEPEAEEPPERASTDPVQGIDLELATKIVALATDTLSVVAWQRQATDALMFDSPRQRTTALRAVRRLLPIDHGRIVEDTWLRAVHAAGTAEAALLLAVRHYYRQAPVLAAAELARERLVEKERALGLVDADVLTDEDLAPIAPVLKFRRLLCDALVHLGVARRERGGTLRLSRPRSTSAAAWGWLLQQDLAMQGRVEASLALVLTTSLPARMLGYSRAQAASVMEVAFAHRWAERSSLAGADRVLMPWRGHAYGATDEPPASATVRASILATAAQVERDPPSPVELFKVLGEFRRGLAPRVAPARDANLQRLGDFSSLPAAWWVNEARPTQIVAACRSLLGASERARLGHVDLGFTPAQIATLADVARGIEAALYGPSLLDARLASAIENLTPQDFATMAARMVQAGVAVGGVSAWLRAHEAELHGASVPGRLRPASLDAVARILRFAAQLPVSDVSRRGAFEAGLRLIAKHGAEHPARAAYVAGDLARKGPRAGEAAARALLVELEHGSAA